MSFDSQISNFYEKLVVDELADRELANNDEDTLGDIACVALNQLPARYYRYSVDMAFYLSSPELRKMQDDVTAAVDHAIKFVEKHHARR